MNRVRSSRLATRLVSLAVCVAVAGGIAISRRGHGAAHSSPGSITRPDAKISNDPTRALLVPHAEGDVTLDGDLDDAGWAGRIARTGPFFTESGVVARPYSDARLVWGDDHLYVALYAADEDIRADAREPDGPVWLDDAFRLVFESATGERAFDVSALGVVTDARRTKGGKFDYGWQSAIHVATERDGTLNDPRDDDEEWLLELAIPLAALGLAGRKGERIALSARRCDTPKTGGRVCAGWGSTLVLD